MITLNCSDFIYLSNLTGSTTKLDMQVRQYEDQGRVIYLGQGSQVIQFFEKDLEKIFEFILKAKDLPLITQSQGFLK